MLFLGWLAVCFLVVGLINFYLRRFGLPKRKTPGSESKSTGYGSITFSRSGATIGGLLQGAGFSRVAAGAAGVGGESVHWINSILSWIYQSQNRVPDFVDSWLTSLTTEAEHTAKEMQILFEGIHGSPPEFSNFRTESSTSDKVFTILTTVALKDVTLQTSVLGKSASTKATQPVKCDVYIQSLTGQVKCQTQLQHNELGLHLEFVSDPTVKLQIRPTRVDYTVDNEAFEKVVRGAISKAPMRVNWSSHAAGRPSHLRIVEPSDNERTPARRLASGVQLSPRSPMSSTHSPLVDGYEFSPPSSSPSSVGPSPGPPSGGVLTQARGQPFLTQHPESGEFRGQQLPLSSEQQELHYVGTAQGQQQIFSTLQGQQYSPPIQGQQHLSSPLQGQAVQGTHGGQPLTNTQGQQSMMFSQGPKLFIRVVKANGLMDIDFGNCSAFCRVHIDNPPQDFATNVIRNTVNPYWDEQFISDFDRRTKQIQFEVLDRDRQQGNDLLGRAVVLVDEIRRMPSSRQIIPLTGKPKSKTSTSGSVTVEFIFQDPLESQASISSSSNASVTPPDFVQGPSSTQKQSISSITQSPRVPPVRKDDRSRVGSGDYSPYSVRSSAGAVGAGAPQLSAHNLALTPSPPPAGGKPIVSPTVVVTAVESLKSATLQTSAAHGTIGTAGTIEGKKKESFASTLKKTLGRVKLKPRSQSADRSTSRSIGEGNLLRPPDHGGPMGQQSAQITAQQQTNRNAGSASDLGVTGLTVVGSDGAIRKGRSNSFGSSLRRIFRRDKKDISREGSFTKPSVASSSSSPTHLGRGNGGSGGALNAPGQGFDRSRRENTPVPSGDRFTTGGGTEFPYSSSVPAAASPLQRA